MARILYLDDEETLVFLVTRMLGFLGHEVAGYTVPADAVAAFRADPSRFDLLLTDFSMPSMTGLEFAREILAIRGGAPVAVATGHVDPADAQAARDAGVLDVITKPNTLEEMEAAVAVLLAKTRAG